MTGAAGKRIDTSTLASACVSNADTAVSQVFQVRSKKAKGNDNWDRDVKLDEHAPRAIGLSMNLGGDAGIHFEHADPDQEDKKIKHCLDVENRFLESSATPN